MTPVLAFFNNRSGVGKTSLAYHLAWMYSDIGKRVVVADLDPQANLTSSFLNEEELEKIWDEKSAPGSTIFSCVKPLFDAGEFATPILKRLDQNLFFLPGDAALFSLEDALSEQWHTGTGNNNLYRPMRALSAFWQVLQMCAVQAQADIVVLDTGSNLSAINRSALIAANFIIMPLGSDIFTFHGLKDSGPTLRNWARLWQKRLDNWKVCQETENYPEFRLPAGEMKTVGYTCQQIGAPRSRSDNTYWKWAYMIPAAYHMSILSEAYQKSSEPAKDPYCLAIIKHYRSLVAMGLEYKKPIFKLTPADGAVGAHANAAVDARKDFNALALRIADKIGLN